MNITQDADFIYVVGAQAAIRDYLVDHMGASYSKAKNHCKLPRNTHVMNELYKYVPDIHSVRGFMSMGYEMKAEKEAIITARGRLKEMELLQSDLRPYQSEDARMIAHFNSFGVFNEPRTGKTPTVLAGIMEAKAKLVIVISPASLLWNWYYEIQKWVPNNHSEVVESAAKFNKNLEQFAAADSAHKFLLISKNMLPNIVHHIEQFKFDAIIVDEAHFLRNHNTKQSKAIYKLKGDRKYALTGTPTVNHPVDIYGILKFLHPNKYKAYHAFADRYFRKAFNAFSDKGTEVGDLIPERERELQEIVGIYSTTRKRADVMSWLPEKEYEYIKVPMGTAQAKAYNDMKKMFFHTDGEGETDAQNIISQLSKLRQIAIDPRTEGLRAVGAKTHLLKQWLVDNEKPPSLIMSMFTGYLNILKDDLMKEGYNVAMLTGQESLADKQENVRRFQNGEVDILLCNTITAGTGWTLDRSEVVIFMDNAWNPADQQQAEDRITPVTPDRVHRHRVVILATAGTVDEWMFELLRTKKRLTDIINEGGSKIITELLR